MKTFLSLPVFFALFLTACSSEVTEDKMSEETSAPAMESRMLEDGAYTVDTEKSTFGWTGQKLADSHTGTIDITEGSLKVGNGTIEGGSFTIDMTSINTTDLEGKGKENMDGHLKNEDFFNVEAFPTATFEITSSEGTKITGDLTIKDITNEISFDAMFEEADGIATAQAEFSIDRTLWDIKYGSGKFFSDLGDKVIKDEMEMKINLVLKQ